MRALILAGGSGTRFWPVSRAQTPKQLVALWGGKSMIRHTVERVLPWGEHNVFIVCGTPLLAATREAAGLDDTQMVAEPAARNTCAAIALGCLNLAPDDVVAVMPSDHFVRDVPRFRETLEQARGYAEQGFIVTIGIEPTRPETGFGYIRTGAPIPGGEGKHVDSFVEKPDRQTALFYLADGGYVWNAGIFVFKVATFFDELRRQKPQMADAFDDMRNHPEHVETHFPTVQSISVDYAIMENAQKMAVIPANFGWSDVGHWAALDEVSDVDANGNVTSGDVLVHDTRNSVVFSNVPGRFVAVVGMDGVVVADTPDALLVIPREKAQDVRKVVDHLTHAGRTDRI